MLMSKFITFLRAINADGQPIKMDRFGALALGETVMREYGFSLDHIYSPSSRID